MKKTNQHPYNFIKLLTLSLWISCSSVYLFIFFVVTSPKFDIFQLINFSILVYGAGFAYSVFAKLATTTYSHTKKHLWKALLKPLSTAFIIYLSAGIIFFLAVKNQEQYPNLAIFFAILTYLLAMIWTTKNYSKLVKPLQDLNIDLP